MLVAAAVVLLAAASAATEPGAPPSTEPAPAGNGESVSLQVPDGYRWVVDDTSSIVVAVPDGWSDTDLAPAPVSLTGGVEVPYLAASPDREGFLTGFGAPGVRFVALPYSDIDAATFAELYGLDDVQCREVDEVPYADPVFTGTQITGTGCGQEASTWHLIVAAPDERDFTVVLDVQVLDAADEAAFGVILETFNLTDTAVAPTVPSTVPATSAPESGEL